jgi:Carboxypeptidase regulatory-like domain/TonB-dependent Receptor Plug Domain
MGRRVFAAAFVLLSGVTAAFAQQGTGDLQGRVLDEQGAVLPGVTIVVRHQASGLFRETVSGSDGSFLLSAMIPGPYQIEAELLGFKKFTRRDVRIEVGKTVQTDVILEVGRLEQTVVVTAEAPLVDTTSKEIGGNVSAQEFIDTPSFNRNFAGYLGMLPGVVATISATTFGADSISVAGQNIRNVNYTMDGSNNNDTFNGGNGGSQARVPVEAVQEFQLLTSQFDAEYGLASGGIVNSVSKQGTNTYHGSAFFFYQDEKLSAIEYFARREGLDKAQTKQRQWGGTIGGPIVRDKAHYFFSLERVSLDGGVTTNIPTRPDLNQTNFETTRVWNTFLRGDHQLNAANTWGLRWLRETSPQPRQIQAENHTPARFEAETDIDWTLVGNLSSVISSSKLNTFRVSAVKEDVFFGNPNFNSNGHNQKILPPRLDYLNFQDQQSARANRRLDVAYGGDDVFSWFVPNKGGDHDLKFGVNYLYSTLRVQDDGSMNGIFTLNTDLPFDRNNPRTYPERLQIRVPGAVNFLMKGHFIGMFAQDKWKLRNRLTLSLGGRYDLEILPTPNRQNPLFAGDPDGYPNDLNNVSPRLGFSWALDAEGRSAVRGGAGLFYQRTSYTFLTTMLSGGRFSDSFLVNFPTNNVDPGPRGGQFPTEPLLRGGPSVDHAAIDALFPPGTQIRNGGTVRFDDPDRQNAYARQYSLGYERQVGSTAGISVDFIRSEQRNQYVLKELNPGVRDSGLATGRVTRTNPLVGTASEWAASVVTLVNEGWIDYQTLQVSGTKRFSDGWQGRLSYAWSRGRGNTSTGQADPAISQVLDNLNLDRDIGPTNVDRPHILTLSGSYDVPRTRGLKLTAVYSARSGTPFTLIDSTFDADRNSFTTNEYLAAGRYRGTGEDALEVDYKGGRNGARGPNYQRLDFRAGYRIPLAGGRTLDAFLDVFNLTNEPNFANPINVNTNTNNVNSADQRLTGTFLRLTQTLDESPTRTAQINVRYGF